MNQFLNVSSGGNLLKNYYAGPQPMSVLQSALKKRRRKKMKQYGFEPNDMNMIEQSNMGYGKMRGLF